MLALAALVPAAAGAHPRQARLELGIADFGQYRQRDVERLLRVATRLRLGVVRLTMEWSPGQTRLSGTQLGTVVAARRFRELRVLYTLSFVRGRDASTSGRARRAFVAWATDLVRNGAVDVEATNEPMQPLFWSTADPAGQYAELLAGLYGALHHANPRVTVIAGSLARHHANVFMSELTRALRGRRVADAVSLHYPASTRDFEHRVRLLQLQDRPDLMPWHTGMYRSDWKRQPTYYAVVRTETAINRPR